MAVTKEQAFQEYATYQDFVSKIQNLQKKTSESMQEYVAMNHEIAKNHSGDTNVENVNGFRLSAKQIALAGLVIFLVVLIIFMAFFHLRAMISFIFALVAGGYIFFKLTDREEKKGEFQYVELTDDQKTPGYVELENSITDDLNNLESFKQQYKNFSEKSVFNWMIQSFESIQEPQLPDADYESFEESSMLSGTMANLSRGLTDDFGDAYTKYQDSVARGEMVNNTAKTAQAVAGYGKSAADSAVQAKGAANSAVASAGVAGAAAGSSVASANVAGQAANSAGQAANAAWGSAGAAAASAAAAEKK